MVRRVPVLVAVLCAFLALLSSCAVSETGDGSDGRLPGVPTGVTATAGSPSTVHVMWNAVASDRGIGGYEVYRGTTKVKQVPDSEHMVDVTGLRPSTVYVFTVRARDRDGRLGPPSREVRARTPAPAVADHAAPTRPGGPEGRAIGSRAVQLSWSKATDDRGVLSYDVYQGGVKIHGVGGNQTATVITGLRPGTRYVFTVRARDAADHLSPASSPVRLTTPGTDDGRGTAPTGFRAAARRADGAYYLDLSWVPPRTEGVVTEYQVRLDGRTATSLVYGGEAPRERATYSFSLGRDAVVRLRVRIRARLPDGTWGGYSAERTVCSPGCPVP